MDFTTWTTGERFLADGAQFQRRTDAEVDRKAVIARLSVWSPAGPAPRGPRTAAGDVAIQKRLLFSFMDGNQPLRSVSVHTPGAHAAVVGAGLDMDVVGIP